MDCDFKEFNPYKSLENFGESKALWYERYIDRDRRWLNKEIKMVVLKEIKTIAKLVLTEKQKQVFYLYLQGMSQREMARVLSISRNSVKCRWKGIVKNLQKHTTHLAYYWKLY